MYKASSQCMTDNFYDFSTDIKKRKYTKTLKMYTCKHKSNHLSISGQIAQFKKRKTHILFGPTFPQTNKHPVFKQVPRN